MLGKCALMLNRVAIGVWVGAVGFMFVAGLAVLGAMPGGTVFVAPGDASLRVSAGDVVGTIFRQYYGIAAVLGAVALVGVLVSRRAGLWCRVPFIVHINTLCLMLACLAFDAGFVYGKVHALAEQIPDQGLQPDSPIYGAFWMWHGIGMLLSVVVFCLGLVAAAASAWPVATAE
jgi:hypothetical protein